MTWQDRKQYDQARSQTIPYMIIKQHSERRALQAAKRITREGLQDGDALGSERLFADLHTESRVRLRFPVNAHSRVLD